MKKMIKNFGAIIAKCVDMMLSMIIAWMKDTVIKNMSKGIGKTGCNNEPRINELNSYHPLSKDDNKK